MMSQNTIQLQPVSKNLQQEVFDAYEGKSYVKPLRNGFGVTFSPNSFQNTKESAQMLDSINEGLKILIENTVYKNSTQVLRPIGVFEELVDTMLKPVQQRPFVKYTSTPNEVGYTEQNVGIEDICKPNSKMSISRPMEKFIMPKMDLRNFAMPIQSGMSPNPYNVENAQPDLGTVAYDETPICSYAFPHKYNIFDDRKNESHPFLGQHFTRDMLLQQHMQFAEQKYIVDIFGSKDGRIAGNTFIDQENQTVINNFGIPNNTLGLADPTLTKKQFDAILLKIVQEQKSINNTVDGTLYGQMNTFVMPMSDVNQLQQTRFDEVDTQLTSLTYTNGFYKSRMHYLVSFLSANGITVYATPLLNPTSVETITDANLSPSTVSSPLTVVNDTDRPIYLLLNNNDASIQSIMFASKITVMQTSFVQNDALGIEMIMGKIDLFSGIKHARPELTRRIITTNAI